MQIFLNECLIYLKELSPRYKSADDVRYNNGNCNVYGVKNIIKANFLLKLAHCSAKITL